MPRSSGLVLLILSILFNSLSWSDARYLPTRSNDDQLDRLRELLRDILETDNADFNQQQQQQRHPAVDNGIDDFRTKELAASLSRAYPSLVDDHETKFAYKRGIPLKFSSSGKLSALKK